MFVLTPRIPRAGDRRHGDVGAVRLPGVSRIRHFALQVACVAALAACAGGPMPEARQPTQASAALGGETAPAAFFQRITALCGNAYEGRISADVPGAAANDPFHGQRLVMHVRECSAEEIRIPFHVGEDRSRTWVITRTGEGLRLKHDHRQPDGREDPVTQYGGDTVIAGTPGRQEFPADAESRALFTRNAMTVSNANVWALEVDPGRAFTYELARPQRLFRVAFDLTTPVPAPPPPSGAVGVRRGAERAPRAG